MIQDPFYSETMQRKVSGEDAEIAHSHESMLTPTEFENLQVRLGRKGKPHYSKKDLPYKILKCGECSGNVTASDRWHIVCSSCSTKFSKGKKTEKCPKCSVYIDEMKNPKLYYYVHYECINKKKGKGCSQGSLSIKSLEDKILNELSRYEIPVEFKDWSIKYLNELNTDEEKKDSKVKKSIQHKYNDANQQLKNLGISLTPLTRLISF